MIERKIIATRMKEFMIQTFVSDSLQNVGYSKTKVQKTPLGEKIIIYASRPGLIVGRKGLNIKTLTKNLKHKFKLENPQIEINEITNPNIDAQIVAERIQSTLERFGSKRFKGVGHKSMDDVMKAGAMGCEILISGKIPSSRAKRWRFYQGYLKKSGEVAVSEVAVAYASAQLKSGTVGIQVRIMLPNTKLPDVVELKKIEIIEDLDSGDKEQVVTEVKEKDIETVNKVVEKLEKSKETEEKESDDKKTTKEEKKDVEKKVKAKTTKKTTTKKTVAKKTTKKK